MRILTPANAYFGASGVNAAAGLPLAASSSITEDVNGDFGPISTPFFTPADGVYFWTLFVKTNSPSTAGTITVNVTQPGSGQTHGVTGNLALTGLAGAAVTISQGILFAADGIVNIEREVVGFVAPTANYSFYVTMYLLAG